MILNTIHNEKSENKNVVEIFFRKKETRKKQSSEPKVLIDEETLS